MIRQTDAGVEIEVHVVPRSAHNEIAGERHGRLLVRLGAPPVDNAANDALIKLLSKRLDIAPAAIELTRGGRSRNKCVTVRGLSEATVRQRLARPPAGLSGGFD